MTFLQEIEDRVNIEERLSNVQKTMIWLSSILMIVSIGDPVSLKNTGMEFNNPLAVLLFATVILFYFICRHQILFRVLKRKELLFAYSCEQVWWQEFTASRQTTEIHKVMKDHDIESGTYDENRPQRSQRDYKITEAQVTIYRGDKVINNDESIKLRDVMHFTGTVQDKVLKDTTYTYDFEITVYKPDLDRMNSHLKTMKRTNQENRFQYIIPELYAKCAVFCTVGYTILKSYSS